MTDEGPIRINHAWCKGCGICVAFCPKKVFESDAAGHPVVFHPGQCTRCLLCEERCPDLAIEIEKRKKDHEDPA